MGGGGSGGRGGRPSPGGSRGLLLLAEPPLQGAFAGQGGRVGGVGQADADVTGPPGGVLLPQGHGLGVERVAVGGSAGAGLVGGRQTVGPLVEALQQLPDGPGAHLQGVGDGGGIFAAAGPPLDEAAQGHGDGCRHGVPSW